MTVQIIDALQDIEIAFLQLEFAIKLLSFCELGEIDPAKFDTDHITLLEQGSIRFPTGNFSTSDSIVRAASISVLIAFSASALVIDKAFEIAGVKPDPDKVDLASQLRTLIYMVRCAQAHGMADPRWEVRGKFLRRISVDLNGTVISIDLAGLDGKPFHIDQIGGYPNWYRIREAVVRVLK